MDSYIVVNLSKSIAIPNVVGHQVLVVFMTPFDVRRLTVT